MPKLGNALISTKSRRISFSHRLEREISAARASAPWRSAALIALATTVLWLAS